MHRYLAEFIGTFFLVLSIGLGAVFGMAGDLGPIAVAATLAGVIYAGGHVSAAHYNPAVTVAFRLRGRMATRDILPYMVAQTAAAAAASLTAVWLAPDATVRTLDLTTARAATAEFTFTFVLVWVILHVATAPGTAGNPFYGAAIAAVVLGGILTVGPISGAVFNPAVAVGLCVMNKCRWSSLWIYFAAQFAAAVAAALAFRLTCPDADETLQISSAEADTDTEN